MIEYAKSILPKVAEWEELFSKELLKSYVWLPKDEIPEFRDWCYSHFQHLHPNILAHIFNPARKGINLTINRRKLVKEAV